MFGTPLYRIQEESFHYQSCLHDAKFIFSKDFVLFLLYITLSLQQTSFSSIHVGKELPVLRIKEKPKYLLKFYFIFKNGTLKKKSCWTERCSKFLAKLKSLCNTLFFRLVLHSCWSLKSGLSMLTLLFITYGANKKRNKGEIFMRENFQIGQ